MWFPMDIERTGGACAPGGRGFGRGPIVDRFSRVGWLLLGILAWARPCLPAETQASSNLLATLRPGHPRLFAQAAEFERVRSLLGTEAMRKKWWDTTRSMADRQLSAAPVSYDLTPSGRLSGVGRRVVERAYNLAFVWHMTGDRRYSDRLMREVEAVAAFKDWNPASPIDLAEICHGVGLAYDWCHAAWTPTERAVARAALVGKGFRPALAAFRAPADPSAWPHVRNNHLNPVVNGALIVAALAVADEEPGPASEILAAATASLRNGLAGYGPDGGWVEGPAYWGYSTIYSVAALAALDTALGTDFGLSAMPGLAATGLFPLQITGPRSRTFNYADSRDAELRGPQFFWLARRFDLPACAAAQKENSTAHPLDYLWYDEALAARNADDLPLDRHFRGPEVVSFRSAWGTNTGALFGGAKSIFVAFKGGDNGASRAHLDQGTFILDALGARWAMDQGAEEAPGPGYLGTNRWAHYATRAEGHNTLVLNPDALPDQDPKAVAPITRFASRPDEALAVADLSAAYARHARRVQRGITLRHRRTEVLVQDEIEADKPADVWWFLHTTAKIDVDGRTATLSMGTNRVTATLIGGPPEAVFSVTEAAPFPSTPAAPYTKAAIRRLTIRMKQVREARFAVRFLPPRPETAPAPTDPSAPLVPLADWK